MPRSDRRAFILGAASGAALLALGCRSTAKVSEEHRSARIVSVAPSMTETVFALGAGERMVGRTTFCDYPPEAKALPTVGGFVDTSVEAILALDPTLVVGERRPGGRDLDQSLRDRGIETFFPAMHDVGQIRDMIIALAARLHTEEKAAHLIALIDAQIGEVRARTMPVHGEPPRKPRVLFLFDFKPLVAAGPGTFPNELLGIAGAENVVKTGGEYPQLSPEGVLALDPDVVVDGSAGAYAEPPEALLAAVPGLAAMRALTAKAVRRLPSNAAVRPGPRIGAGAGELAATIYGWAPR